MIILRKSVTDLVSDTKDMISLINPGGNAYGGS